MKEILEIISVLLDLLTRRNGVIVCIILIILIMVYVMYNFFPLEYKNL